MNTPEQAGAALARDMIALVEAHFTQNDQRMIAMNSIMGAFLEFEELIFEGDSEQGLDRHNAFSKVVYPYMRDCIKNSASCPDDVKERMLEANAEMCEVYGVNV